MRRTLASIRQRLDSAGILLSGLCAVHCVLSIVLVSVLGVGSQTLLSPSIHETGLLLAVIVGAITLGIGAWRHGSPVPLVIGTCGVALMAAALLVGHGVPEAVLTIAGVALVATAHIRNLRHAH